MTITAKSPIAIIATATDAATATTACKSVHLDDLPRDVVRHIFSYLFKPAELIGCDFIPRRVFTSTTFRDVLALSFSSPYFLSIASPLYGARCMLCPRPTIPPYYPIAPSTDATNSFGALRGAEPETPARPYMPRAALVAALCAATLQRVELPPRTTDAEVAAVLRATARFGARVTAVSLFDAGSLLYTPQLIAAATAMPSVTELCVNTPGQAFFDRMHSGAFISLRTLTLFHAPAARLSALSRRTTLRHLYVSVKAESDVARPFLMAAAEHLPQLHYVVLSGAVATPHAPLPACMTAVLEAADAAGTGIRAVLPAHRERFARRDCPLLQAAAHFGREFHVGSLFTGTDAVLAPSSDAERASVLCIDVWCEAAFARLSAAPRAALLEGLATLRGVRDVVVMYPGDAQLSGTRHVDFKLISSLLAQCTTAVTLRMPLQLLANPSRFSVEQIFAARSVVAVYIAIDALEHAWLNTQGAVRMVLCFLFKALLRAEKRGVLVDLGSDGAQGLVKDKANFFINYNGRTFTWKTWVAHFEAVTKSDVEFIKDALPLEGLNDTGPAIIGAGQIVARMQQGTVAPSVAPPEAEEEDYGLIN